jgi:CO/xanthine dehydrogenase Mo-binding subunit
MVARILQTEPERVRIVPVTLGGYFGGKDEDMAIMSCRVALLAKKTGRPVKISNSREESILESTKRHRYVMKYKIGAKGDGVLTAMDIKVLADAGAYAGKTPLVTYRSCVEATGPYVVPHVRTEVHCVFTNNNNAGSFRGFGSPQVNFAAESIMDELSDVLEMDPYELRQKNAFEENSETATQQKLSGRVTVKECMAKAISQVPWIELRGSRSAAPLKRGIGLAVSFRGVSLGGQAVDAAGAIVSIQDNCQVVVSCGIREGGQGTRTVLCQICAETLG